jgi:carboxyl-terminal processing protease
MFPASALRLFAFCLLSGSGFCLAMAPLTLVAAEAPAPKAEAAAEGSYAIESLRVFVETLDRIRSHYVEPIDDETLLEDAIEGMVQRLDPHSSYLTGDAYAALQEATEGVFGGIGVEILEEEGRLKVVAPIDGTPAAEAGLRPGDWIEAVDGERTAVVGTEAALGALRGEIGEPVTLTLRRPSEEDSFNVTLTRALIDIPSVSQRWLVPGLAYLRITQFQTHTGEDLRAALEALQSEQALAGVVLDLRNNPGGVLSSGVAVADAFLDGGLIVETRGRGAGANERYEAQRGDLTGGAPVVVLINEGTASASEIVAGALQDHGRGLLLGQRSFGKGSVQTLMPLSETRALKITTARYYTPSGRSIQAQGIVPDLQGRGLGALGERAPATREADLPGHLDAPGEDVSREDTLGGLAPFSDEDGLLMEAVRLLQAHGRLGGA